MTRLARNLVNRLRTVLEHVADHHGAPELLVAVIIMTGWASAGFQQAGFVAVIAAIVFGLALHSVAVETGGFGWLWLATGLVLLYIAFARSSVLADHSPVWLAVAGASALAYNEAVRSNHWRRRNADASPRLFISAGLAVVAAGVLGVAGIAVAGFFGTNTPPASWWQPLAAASLFALAAALLLTPSLRVTESSRQRWSPGSRIPAPARMAGRVADPDGRAGYDGRPGHGGHSGSS